MKVAFWSLAMENEKNDEYDDEHNDEECNDDDVDENMSSPAPQGYSAGPEAQQTRSALDHDDVDDHEKLAMNYYEEFYAPHNNTNNK